MCTCVYIFELFYVNIDDDVGGMCVGCLAMSDLCSETSIYNILHLYANKCWLYLFIFHFSAKLQYKAAK